jgi:hypothetical protein
LLFGNLYPTAKFVVVKKKASLIPSVKINPGAGRVVKEIGIKPRIGPHPAPFLEPEPDSTLR